MPRMSVCFLILVPLRIDGHLLSEYIPIYLALRAVSCVKPSKTSNPSIVNPPHSATSRLCTALMLLRHTISCQGYYQ